MSSRSGNRAPSVEQIWDTAVEIISPTDGATVAIGVGTNKLVNFAIWTATQNSTINLSGAQRQGQRLVLLITVTGASGWIMTFGTGFFAGTAQLVGAPVSKYRIELISDGTIYHELCRAVELEL